MAIDLKATLLGGQCFTWKESDGVYTSVLGGREVAIRGEEDIEREGLSTYFDMDYPYGEARAYLASLSPFMERAISLAPDLHILRQDPWTVTVSFIISQNNNIRRITSLVDALCRVWGKKVGQRYAFPTREELAGATEEELVSLRFGYRSRYLVEIARNFREMESDVSTEEARARLLTHLGIGRKVADCILLFGYHRMDAFPVDTWMRRVMASHFPGRDASFFAPYEGLAQQYLFQGAQSGALEC